MKCFFFKKAIAACMGYRLIIVVAAISLELGASPAWAVGGPCSGGNQVFTLTLPATVSVPRDAPVGSVLTSWVLSPASTNLWTCTTYADNALSYSVAGSLFTSQSGVSVASPYGTPLVFGTNVPGIGIAINAKNYVSAQGYWYNWGQARNVAGMNGLSASGVGPANYKNYTAGAQVVVALVKTASVVAAGGVVTGGQVAYAYPATSYNAGWQYTSLSAKYQITPVTIVPLACSTPNVEVPLGSYRKAEFTGVGYTTNSINFNLGINSCPAGLGEFGPPIQYKVDATTAVINSLQSVVALDSSSGAAGIGVQLLDGNGSVFPLNSYKTLNGYSRSTGGSYSIPFQARYYQTAATVSPGKANVSMMVTMLYQ